MPSARPKAGRVGGPSSSPVIAAKPLNASAIGPARLAGPGGLTVKRRGDQQWGPDAPGA